MKLLITGAYGQLGNELQVASVRHPKHTYLFTDADTLDICQPEALEAYFVQHRPDMLINCAAYTAVDKAEDDPDMCDRINRAAVENIATVAAKYGVQVIHVSTDYVFDGTAYIPYTEDMPACPNSVYGRTKRAGEEVLQQILPSAIIIRTAWLYSSFGNNFVKTMLRLGQERPMLNVVFDQVGTPTYAADLAEAILSIVDSDNRIAGIYHFTNEGVCSWYDFTKAIHEYAGIQGCQVMPIESCEYPSKAPRPHYSVLNKKKIKAAFDLTIPHWVDGLRRCLEKMGYRRV